MSDRIIRIPEACHILALTRAGIIFYFLGDRYVLPAVFSATDSGNVNLLIWLAVDPAMLLPTFYGTRWALFKFGFIDNWLGK